MQIIALQLLFTQLAEGLSAVHRGAGEIQYAWQSGGPDGFWLTSQLGCRCACLAAVADAYSCSMPASVRCWCAHGTTDPMEVL